MKKIFIILMILFAVLSGKDMTAPVYDFQSNLITGQTITNLANQGAGYWFDGTTKVSIPQTYFYKDSSWSVMATFTISDNRTSDAVILGRSGSTGTEYLYVTSYNNLRAESSINGNILFRQDISNGQHTVIMTNTKEDGIIAYIDCRVVDEIFDWDPSATYFRYNQIGQRSTYGQPIKVSNVKFFNKALTADEVKDLYSGSPIPYKHEGATLNYESDFSADNDNWLAWNGSEVSGIDSISDGSISYNDVLMCADFTFIKNVSLSLELNKLYNVSFDFYVDTAYAGARLRYTNDGSTVYPASTVTLTKIANDSIVSESTGSYGYIPEANTGTWYRYDALLDDINNFPRIYFYNVSDTVYIKNVKYKQVGNILDLSPEGVGSYTWLDNSGNDNHGTVSGAVPIGLKPHHNWTAVEDVTTDATMTDAIPEDGLLKYIVVTNETANADTLNFGSSALASDIAANQVIPASETVTITVNKAFATETDISISDANGNGWHSTHVIEAIGEDK